MGTSFTLRAPRRLEAWLAGAVFLGGLGFHFAAATIGWESKNLPGVEFRQAQTALSAFFIKREDNFSLAYPTPVLGRPWSIPLEFPLYQWTVVHVSRLTGLSLTKSARAVSLACFYLMLPAVYLLLARWRVAPGHRWLVLAAVVTCPLYVFYSRAFLMETMALMFSVWFWVAFERATVGRSAGWLGLAIVAGSGAGLVKVTTFLLYLLPVTMWAVARLWHHRAAGNWRKELGWMAAALAIPFAVTLWWLQFSDAVRALNPAAQFLRSDRLTDFTIGTWATRLSAELWSLKGSIVAHQLSWLPLLVGSAVLALLGARHRWRELALCAGVFAAALVTFPVLYAYHEYYYVANTVLLMLAIGLVLVALAESSRPRWVVGLAVLLVVGGQICSYFETYYPAQRAISPGGDGLTQSLRALTEPDEVIIVTGQDWNSMTPHYAQRRALMLRDEALQDRAQVDAALAALAGEKIGALVVTGPLEDKSWLIQRGVALGLEPTPLYYWRDTSIFLPPTHRTLNLQKLEQLGFLEVHVAPGAAPVHAQPVNAWFEVGKLWRSQRLKFAGMTPEPVRFFSTYGLALERSNARIDFGAHPVTRLVFALPAGRHVLRTTAIISPDAYRPDLPADLRTDGVEITLSVLLPQGERRMLHTRLLDPIHRPEDRARVPLRMDFTLPEAGEVELFIGPGPKGRDTRDWVALGRLVIE